MNHYKSWSNLNKKLMDCLCDDLRDRVSYFFTNYHKVHNAYGRAAILVDKKEVAIFKWSSSDIQESNIDYCDNCFYSEMDFIHAALDYLNLSIEDALNSDNDLIKVFAIMDKRVGKRRLEKIKVDEKYKENPDWVLFFFQLRLDELVEPSNLSK